MMSQSRRTVDLLRQVIFSQADLPDFSTDTASSAELRLLYEELLALRQFILSVARGDLSGELDLKGPTAGALKALQASLRHMAWQMQMVADGDFSQRLEFMGEFSSSFNSMTEQLETYIRTIKEKEAELQRINNELLHEIEMRKKTQDALIKSEAHYRYLSENIHDVVWILDTQTLCFTYISPSVEALAGYTPEEMTGRSLESIVTPEIFASVQSQIAMRRGLIQQGKLEPGTYVNLEIEHLKKGGGTIWVESIGKYMLDENTKDVVLIGVTRDITEKRALLTELERLATVDSLTETFNRRYFLECVQKEINRTQRHQGVLAFLMLDIDHFKDVNDNYGHATGDNALRAVTYACREELRDTDVIGRLGGEEFGFLLLETKIPEACEVAERLRARIQAIDLKTEDGRSVPLRASVGVTEYHLGEGLAEFMARADKALYKAKNTGRNKVEYLIL